MDFIILDLICFTASYLMAYALRHGNVGGLFDNIVYINTGIVLIAFDLLTILLFDTMHNVLRRGLLRELTTAIKEKVIVFGAVAI